MAATMGQNFLSNFRRFFVFLLCIQQIWCINQRYIVDYKRVSDCKNLDTDTTHEYFDLSDLKCNPCSQDNNFQIQSPDGLSCQCRPGYRLTQSFGGGSITCEACPTDQMTSKDGWGCVACDAANPFNAVTRTCQPCAGLTVAVERSRNGAAFPDPAATPVSTCQACTAVTAPDDDGSQCEPCSQIVSMIPTTADCVCPADRLTGGLCFALDAYLPNDESSLYTITSNDGQTTVESAYFKDNIRAVTAICNPDKYSNLTACQVLGNMCTLIYSNMENVGRTGGGDACSQYDFLKTQSGAGNDWPASMPWLYYTEQNADGILADTVISTQYTAGSTLNFKLAKYRLDGTFVGIVNASEGELQLCKDSVSKMNAAYKFGTHYHQTCQLPVDDLWNRAESEMYFYDMYIEYLEPNGLIALYPVPVKVWNMKGRGSSLLNQGPRNNWQMTRRFFLLDNISTRTRVTVGVPATGTRLERARLLRYASSITIHVTQQDNTRDGKIFPPYIDIRYSDLLSDSYGQGATVQTTFGVVYEATQGKFNYDLSIAMGTLCSLAAVFAMLRTWGWSRRSGKQDVDFMMILKFLAFCCGSIANIFFIVSFGAAIWFLMFYKNQTIIYLFIPTWAQELPFVVYISVGFCLKVFEMIHLIASQCTIDIFFIDWERPKGRVVAGEKGDESKTSPVSIWRTYFVANEWNEIQTFRKINPTLQVFAVVFFLEVVGFGNFSTADPSTNYGYDTNMYRSPDSRVFRYAIAGSVYIVIALLQYLFFVLIYERFIENKIEQYTDLCSVSNVSVFIMHHAQYGYYIHGRSVQGTADTGMREMHEALKREESMLEAGDYEPEEEADDSDPLVPEALVSPASTMICREQIGYDTPVHYGPLENYSDTQEDLCSHRGLMPNSDQQTYEMALPKRLRTHYHRIMAPLYARESAVSRAEKGQTGTSSIAGTAIAKSINAYQTMTKFLSSFIDHSLKDIDYTVTNKLLLENILDVEFTDTNEKGLFYNDDGHAFDECLFYGCESTLLLFDVFTFCLIDLLSQNFVLSGVITYIIQQIVVLIRDGASRRNLARKTLIDERFLI